ncbi:MAG: tRNA lysidine(34) synthetase TilS [Alcanivoracaceae bacterium]|nr:tRNA lysidine(34) synthetase TilS [Alcanivoracaceae bacterium]
MTPDALPDQLRHSLGGIQGRLVLGYSGGLDSSVLLAALCRAGLAERLLAVHVHHGLHADADQWLAHCRRQAEQAGVDFIAEHVDVAGKGNLEQRARRARRQALLGHVGEQDVLLLAHHRQDQAETLMLRLLRGAGARGLAAMVPVQRWQDRDIYRPLLMVSRADLAQAAAAWQLPWLDDPANDQLHFDRNFLRHRVMPVVAERWPEAAQSMQLSASVLAEQADLLDELAWQDFVGCDGGGDSLALTGWAELSPPRRRNLMYGWCRRRGIRPPPADRVARIDTELVPAAEDRQPEICWPDGVLLRYRQRLWLLSPSAREPLTGCHLWQPAEQSQLCLGEISVGLAEHGELILRATGQPLQIRAAEGGERILLRGRHRQVSELWRVAGIPPWRRQRLPLFFIGDELVAAAAVGVADGWSAVPGEAAFRLTIEDSAL